MAIWCERGSYWPTYLVLVLLEHLDNVLGAERLLAFAWCEGDDRVLDLLGREDVAVEVGVGVDGVLRGQRLAQVSQPPTQSLGNAPFSITIFQRLGVGL